MRTITHIISLVLFSAVTAFVVISCAEQGSRDAAGNAMRISEANNDEFNMAEFERNRNLWTSQNIQHYKMIIGASGFLTNFPEQVEILVKNGRPVSTRSLSTTDRNATSTYKGYDSVNNLFAFIDDRNKRRSKTAKVKYDRELGFPRQIFVDQDGHEGNDDEIRLAVESLEVLK